MGMRAFEKGWIRILRYDLPRRRSLWVRLRKGKIEFCSGREGDDGYASLRFSRNNSLRDLYDLIGVIKDAIYALETLEYDSRTPEERKKIAEKWLLPIRQNDP